MDNDKIVGEVFMDLSQVFDFTNKILEYCDLRHKNQKNYKPVLNPKGEEGICPLQYDPNSLGGKYFILHEYSQKKCFENIL